MMEWHFLRPAWFLALLPLATLLWWWLRASLRAGSWQQVVDARLLPHLLMGEHGAERRWPVWLAGLLGLLTIIALAGPVFEKLPQPVFRAQSALVIVLDLSRSMNAADLKPSRLARARIKVKDILERRREGQTALVVYAGAPFVMSPLTEDTATITAQLDAIDTELMPAQGSRVDLAIAKAVALLNQAGVAKGEILLVTDGVSEDADVQAVAGRLHGHRLSVLGVGTAEGAPIPQGDGQFIKDAQGSIVVSKLTPDRLATLAADGDGRYRAIRADDQDIAALLQDADVDRLDANTSSTDLQTDLWREEGPWLLLLVIPLAALGFRRGWLAAVLLVVLLPQPQPAMAGDWDNLWSSPDQRAAKALAAGDAKAAADTFQDRRWRAAAQYRAGQYQEAAKTLDGLDDAESLYNRGNALAKANDKQGAIAAYEQALEKNPQLEDARYNRDLLQRQQQNQKSDDKDHKKKNDDQQDKGDSQADQGDQSRDDKSQQQNKKDGRQGKQENDQQQNAGDQGAQNPEQKDAADKSQDTSKEKAKSLNKQDKQAEDKSREEAKDSQAEDAADQQAKPGEETPQTESQQANEQWLRRIPDDPGGLWRRKFRYQYGQGEQQQDEVKEAW